MEQCRALRRVWAYLFDDVSWTYVVNALVILQRYYNKKILWKNGKISTEKHGNKPF